MHVYTLSRYNRELLTFFVGQTRVLHDIDSSIRMLTVRVRNLRMIEQGGQRARGWEKDGSESGRVSLDSGKDIPYLFPAPMIAFSCTGSPLHSPRQSTL